MKEISMKCFDMNFGEHCHRAHHLYGKKWSKSYFLLDAKMCASKRKHDKCLRKIHSAHTSVCGTNEKETWKVKATWRSSTNKEQKMTKRTFGPKFVRCAPVILFQTFGLNKKKKVYIFFIKSKNLKTKSQARIERKYAHTKKNSRKLIQKSKKACGKNPQRADFFPKSILHVFLMKNRKKKKKTSWKITMH